MEAEFFLLNAVWKKFNKSSNKSKVVAAHISSKLTQKFERT